MRFCSFTGCEEFAEPAHSPCCSSHRDIHLCCEHYCRSHFVLVNGCTPEDHL